MCIKLATIFFAFVLVKGARIIWNIDILNLLSIWWWLLLMIVFIIKPIYKFFKKEDAGNN